MIRSMTGFGQAEGLVGTLAVQVDVRTVNHRFFSPSIKLPGPLSRWEGEVREAMRRQVARGHVTLSVRAERSTTEVVAIDEGRFAVAVAQLRALRDRHGLDGPIDLATVLRLPNLLGGTADEVAVPETPESLVALVDRALVAMTRMREEEGARLRDVLVQRLDLLEQAVARIAARAPERLVAQRDRLRQAVVSLTEGIPLDEGRLVQEVALLADRLDVSEEVDRFRSHLTAFRSALGDSTPEPVGKRLGFLIQEMLRETNTTGSKGADAALLHDVVGMKEELERIREQVENLE
jgi:uncharacterized protein (TIGR00255 family)